jgi:hypothetical protein
MGNCSVSTLGRSYSSLDFSWSYSMLTEKAPDYYLTSHIESPIMERLFIYIQNSLVLGTVLIVN